MRGPCDGEGEGDAGVHARAGGRGRIVFEFSQRDAKPSNRGELDGVDRNSAWRTIVAINVIDSLVSLTKRSSTWQQEEDQMMSLTLKTIPFPLHLLHSPVKRLAKEHAGPLPG